MPEKIYDTENKKIFHDIDCLDRYTSERIEEFKKMFNNNKDKILELLKKALSGFILLEFKKIAKKKEWML